MFNWFRKKRPSQNGFDFLNIDSRKKAEAAERRGELEKLFMMPIEFGGEDIALNSLFVPVGIADVKARIDNDTIRPLIEEGQVTKYSATPEYQGDSFVPIAIKIEASNPGNFTATINIWGDALSREND